MAEALPFESVDTEETLSAAKPPRTMLKSTTAPDTPAPLASRTITLTVAGLELVIRLGVTTSVTEVNAEDEICNTTCALTGVPATVALATIWSAPLLVPDLGVSTA